MNVLNVLAGGKTEEIKLLKEDILLMHEKHDALTKNYIDPKVSVAL